ncbi:hypothetical protein FRC08_008803 [Ceratobasidium sp. 394]|nr:hypothetical protein FRC08_008803 [Ceratobasidium sp. 394]KAG9097032.1 hypothetical protein FS749_007155 [Ceratobasidium sp. UAMH 11750]
MSFFLFASRSYPHPDPHLAPEYLRVKIGGHTKQGTLYAGVHDSYGISLGESIIFMRIQYGSSALTGTVQDHSDRCLE